MRYEDASLSGSFQDQGPIARDDAEQLAAGERGPATGNVISGAGTQSGAAGADTAAGAQITALSGAGGNDSSADGGRFRVEGEHGTLSLSPRGDYSYSARPNVPENSRDVFTYTLSDASGASSQARLLIEIGKTPAVVRADAQRVVPGPDGTVVLPAGVELSDVRIVGRDLLIMLPDGSQMLIVDGAVFVPQLVINDIEVPSTNLAALLIDQEPRPASGVPQSSGGNFIEEVGPLDPGTDLGDLLPPTQIDYVPPEFSDEGLEEDRQPETGDNALIRMDDDARPGGNAGGTGDDPDAVNVSGTLAGSGGDGPLSFAFTTAGAPAGFSYAVNAAGALVVSQGNVVVLTVTLDAQTGAYSVVQNAPISHAAGENENNLLLTFTYVVTDRDGDEAQGTVQLDMDDDTPTLTISAGAGEGSIILTTDDADTRGTLTDSASSSANFGGLFSLAQSVGADGLGTAGALAYTLGTPGGASGLTQGGAPINLFLVAGRVVGSTATSAGAVTAANSVFDVSVGTNGVVTLTQYSQIDHTNTDPTPGGSPFNDQVISLADGLVTLTASASITDRDGDTAQGSAAIQIGANLRFTDDGPDSSLVPGAARPSLILDESQPIGTDTDGAGAPGGLATVSASFAGLFAANPYGADGAGSTVYSLVLNGSNVGSGLYALQVGDVSASDGDPLGRGQEILLSQSGNVITGSVGGQNFFTITVNPQTGEISFTQLLPVWNPAGGASYDEAAVLSAAANALVLRQTVTDRDGDSDSSDVDLGQGIFQIQDDGPRAVADAGSLSSGNAAPATGNVLANDSQGRDGATVYLVDANGQPVTSLAGQFGVLTLNANGDYSYVRNAGTPGNVNDVFTYVLRDTDGDIATASLTISIGNLVPTVQTPAIGANGTVVNESALGERGAGESQGSSEQLAPGANGDPREATSGTINFTQGDGPADIRIANVLVTGVNQLIDTGEGTLRIDAITAGSISYTYTLKDNVVVSGASSQDVIPVSVTDKDGDVAPTNLIITINNDRPDAIDDVDDIVAGSFAPATGNVLTGLDTVPGDANASDGVADVLGADGARVVAVSGVTSDDSVDANGNLVVNGQHGVLTLKADGSYSYVRNEGGRGGVEDVFTYTVRDADGDQDTATLTIRIGNTAPTIVTPAPATVFEAALGERGAGESQGSSEEFTDGADGDKREVTSGTISFTQGDGPAQVSIGGVVVTGANQLIDTGEGTLRIDAITAGSISYTYTLKDNVLVGGQSSTDLIPISVRDSDNQVATADLAISIRNDAPDARDDLDRVGDAAAPATGNVITGIDRAGGDSNSTDGSRDIQGADGAFVSQIASDNRGGAATAVNASGSTVIQGAYGQLTINRDGSYSYLRNGNEALDADDVFTYTLQDNDGDTDTARLTIQIRDTGVVVDIPEAGGATTTVFERGLPERAGGPAGSGEIADNNGTDNDDTSEAVSGTITFSARDGVSSITLANTVLNLNQPFAAQMVSDNATGTLVVTSYSFNASTGQGTIGYTYTLKNNTSGDNSSASFGLTVRDADGDSNGGNLVIAIRDDAPDAINDSDALAAGNYGPATGNVISGIDRSDGDTNILDGVRDVQGADGAFLAQVRSNNLNGAALAVSSSESTVIQGQYGTLTVNRDGSYSYARSANTPGGVQEVFTYRLQDGDGDFDDATLTIAIGNSTPSVNAPDVGADGTQVNEKGLGLPATRDPGDSLGSGEEVAPGPDGDPSERSSTGVITYSAGDGSSVIRINGTIVTGTPGQTIDTGPGILTITSFTATTIGYRYELKDNLLVSGDSAEDVITVSVTDRDNETRSDTLKIVILDDAPKAADDRDTIERGGLTATGNVVTGVDRQTGGDANTTDGVRDIQGADGAFVSAVSSANLESEPVPVAESGDTVIQGLYGALTISADGSYSYTRTNGNPLNGTVEDRFFYTLKDGDGDLSEAELTIAISDNGVTTTVPTVGAGTEVDEKGLPARNNGEPAGSGEAADPVVNDNSEITSGTISFVAKDGLGSVSLGGLVVNLSTVLPTAAFAVDKGSLVITSLAFDPSTGAGSISYTYTLGDNTSGNATSAVLPLIVTDSDGDSDTKNLVIAIKDDAPIANDDIDSVGATTGPATGNLITGVDRAGGDSNGLDGVADVPGADGASVVAVAQGGANNAVFNNALGAYVITGAHGTLTVFANGEYSYVRTNGNPLIADEQFTYTIRDGDGDEDSAVLKIEIRDNDVIARIPGTDDASTIVYEASLPARGNEPAGSDESDPRELVSGAITFSAPDGIGELKLAGASLSVGMARTEIATTPLGVLTVTSVTFNSTTGVYTVNYEYLLKDNSTTGTQANGDARDSFAFSVKDSDGDSRAGDLIITIRDDAPVARLDLDSVTEGGETTGNVILATGTDNAVTGKDTPGADGVVVVGVQKGAVNAASSGGVATEIAGTYGKLTLNADGSYSYKADADKIPTGQMLEDVFTYTIRDGDGDLSFANLVIKVSDVTLPRVDQTGTVEEKALDLVKDGDDLVAGVVNGSDPDSPLETAKGDLDVTGATQYTLTGGTNNVIDSPLGRLSLNAATGEWVYTLVRPASNVAPNTEAVTETFSYVARDGNGNSVPGTITITIVDDKPTAVVEPLRIVVEGGPQIAGNLITDSENNGGRDIVGADGATLTSVTVGGVVVPVAVTGVTSHINANGSYTFEANGSWTFTPAASLNSAAGTDAGFSYTIRDGDGDTSTSSQPIRIDDGAGPLKGTDITLLVDDQNLADGRTPAGPDFEEKSITFTPGSDPITTIEFGAIGSLSNALTWVRVDGSKIVGSDGARPVIELTLVRSGNSVSVKATLLDNFDSHAGVNADDLANLGTVEVIARDLDGDEAKNIVTVTISDDVPVANDDAFTVLEGGPTSIDLTVRANDVNGADGFDSISFASVTGTYGSITFKPDGTPVYTLSTSGAAALQALGNGQTLTEKFNYTLKDGDNDTDPAEVVITLRGTDDPVTITNLTPTADGGDALVDEDDLPTGSDTVKESTTGTGDFNISAPDGMGTLKVAGFDLFVNGQFVVNSGGTTPLGNTIRFTAYDPATGKVSYSYTLNDAETHPTANGENARFEELPVVLTDRDGSTANGILSVKIVDDIAKANDDLGIEILEGGPNSINFDVDTNDVPGADGTGTRTFTSLTGTYGTLTLEANGTQTYTLNTAGQAAINALAPGATLTDSFSYTLTDADGDPSSANVLVTLRGTDDPVTITNLTPAADGGDASVDEDDLPAGSDTSKESLTTTGTFTISAPDGVDDLTVGGIAVIVNGAFQSGATGTTPEGHTITFTNYVAATGEVSYSYTLLSREAHAAVQGENAFFDNLPVILTDVDGDQATNTLSIRIIDDVPSVAVTAAAEPTLTVDESTLGSDASASFATAFAALYGADGAAAANALSYVLNVSAAGAASGLTDSATGNGIFLFKDGANVVGRVGVDATAAASGSIAFVLSVNASGMVTLDQQRAVIHSPNTGPDQSLSIANDNLVTISATATDGDGDFATSAGVGIFSNLVFKDDVGSLGAFTGTTVANSAGVVGTGTFGYEQGADTHGSFVITGTPPAGISYGTTQNANGTLLTATGGSPAVTIFTLQVNANGTYEFKLVTPGTATTTTVSLLGLSAGGPTPFLQTPDGLVEFEGSGNGVNSSTQGFGVDNQFVSSTESFSIEFKTIGQAGDQAAGVNARYVSSATLFNDNVNGSGTTYRVTFINTRDGTSEVREYTVTTSNTSLLLDPQNLAEFNRIEVQGIGGDGQGVRFTRLDYTETVLPSDLNLAFNVTAIDKDGDATETRTLNVSIDATPPVVLDLDGNGITYLPVSDGVAYDYTGDGKPELTAWVGKGEGILVRDSNGNGIVDNASEFVFGARGMSDMQALAARYGAVLDQNDADYAKFGVWIDADSDGKFDAGEYQSLAAAKIASIGLVSNGVNANAANGDVHVSGTSEFTRVDGTKGQAADAAFRIVRGNPQSEQAVANSNVGLVSVAAAAAALAAMPAAAKSGAAGEGLREQGDSAVIHIRAANPQANEAAAGASSIVEGAPVLDHAAPQAIEAARVQHHAGGQQFGLDSVEPVSTASGSEQLDQGTEMAAHAPAFFAGGGEISLPAPAEMAALAALGQAGGEAKAQATVAQVLSDALSGGNPGGDIDLLIDAAVSLARDSGGIAPAANDGGPALGEQLASPLEATVPGWDAGHSGPLFAAAAAAMEMHALHPDAVQSVANG